MSQEEFLRADVLEARRKGLIMCPCDATYSRILKKCPSCGRPNPATFEK